MWAAVKKYWIACMTPDARLSWSAGMTTAIASVARTVQTTMIAADRAMARGKSFWGSRVSSAWNPAISMPAKRSMIVAKNGRVETLMTGIRAPGEKGGRTRAAPEPNHQIPSRMIRSAGMMLPRMTPILENFVDTPSPRQAIAVVPQNAIIMTLNMYNELAASAGVRANARVDAMKERTVGNQTRLFDHSQKSAVKPPFSPNACLTQA